MSSLVTFGRRVPANPVAGDQSVKGPFRLLLARQERSVRQTPTAIAETVFIPRSACRRAGHAEPHRLRITTWGRDIVAFAAAGGFGVIKAFFG